MMAIGEGKRDGLGRTSVRSPHRALYTHSQYSCTDSGHWAMLKHSWGQFLTSMKTALWKQLSMKNPKHGCPREGEEYSFTKFKILLSTRPPEGAGRMMLQPCPEPPNLVRASPPTRSPWTAGWCGVPNSVHHLASTASPIIYWIKQGALSLLEKKSA